MIECSAISSTRVDRSTRLMADRGSFFQARSDRRRRVRRGGRPAHDRGRRIRGPMGKREACLLCLLQQTQQTCAQPQLNKVEPSPPTARTATQRTAQRPHLSVFFYRNIHPHRKRTVQHALQASIFPQVLDRLTLVCPRLTTMMPRHPSICS